MLYVALPALFSPSNCCVSLSWCAAVQVYKGIKNGVQDVAVKVLINSDDIQVKLFQEVSVHGRRNKAMRITND